jgi:hypothetical protein
MVARAFFAGLLMLSATAATSITATIPESVAPVSIDRCVALVQSGPEGDVLAQVVDFTNVSQRTANDIRFELKIDDTLGLPQQTLMADHGGRFAPGIPFTEQAAIPKDSDGQPAIALPKSAKVSCDVQMVRFEDGSVWNKGDGPLGNGAMFTPPPQAPPTPSWRFPGDTPPP